MDFGDGFMYSHMSWNLSDCAFEICLVSFTEIPPRESCYNRFGETLGNTVMTISISQKLQFLQEVNQRSTG